MSKSNWASGCESCDNPGTGKKTVQIVAGIKYRIVVDILPENPEKEVKNDCVITAHYQPWINLVDPVALKVDCPDT